MQDDNPKTKIGDVIEISCTQCRLNLDGTVAAMVDDEVVQVTCRTCGNTQKYAPPMDEEDRRKRVMKRVVGGREKKRATQERSAKDMKVAYSPNELTARWRQLTQGMRSAEGAIYNPRNTFQEGDALIHPQHGFGIVTQVIHENAVLVLFREVEVPLEMGAPRKN